MNNTLTTLVDLLGKIDWSIWVAILVVIVGTLGNWLGGTLAFKRERKQRQVEYLRQKHEEIVAQAIDCMTAYDTHQRKILHQVSLHKTGAMTLEVHQRESPKIATEDTMSILQKISILMANVRIYHGLPADTVKKTIEIWDDAICNLFNGYTIGLGASETDWRSCLQSFETHRQQVNMTIEIIIGQSTKTLQKLNN